MKAEKLKRNFWHSSEIECMLNLIKEVKTEGSNATTHFTFVQIANKMKRRGFSNKTATQIRRKWFQMKSAYLCFKKGNTERLMLIPEKFRSVIAEFVDSDTSYCPYAPRTKPSIKTPVNQATKPTASEAIKAPTNTVIKAPLNTTNKPPVISPIKPPVISQIKPPVNTIPSPPTPKKIKVEPLPVKPEETLSDKLIARIKSHNAEMTKDFHSMMSSLMDYEHNCQEIRDNAFLKYLSLSSI